MAMYTIAITLLLIMDPLGNIPVFLAILNHVETERRQWVILRESIIALIILVIFLVGGKYILMSMQLDQASLSIAGGIILFLISIKMIFPSGEENQSPQFTEPFIVPLAVPLIAGPSAMAMVILLATQYVHHLFVVLSGLLIAWLVTTLILLCAQFLRKILGKRVLIAIERLMGMILTALAVQMFLNGISQYFHL